MDISTAYKQHQQVKDLHSQIDEVVAEIKKVDFAYKVAFVGTFVLYFCFIWDMYVADLWGFTTWLTQNISEFVALIIYGILAVTLPLTMALIKEIAYRHFSNYPNSTGMIILIVGILALAGVLYESITSSSQQQHMSFSSAENSKSFEAINNSGATVTTGSIASLIGSAEAKLAKCRKMVERGAWSDCAESEARLQGYLDSEQRGMASAERASVELVTTKQQAIQDLKEEQHKPVFKAIRDSFGVSINTGIMTVTIFVSAIFEISHLLLIMLGAQKKKRLMGLNAALINAESDYMRSTGKTFKAEDFSDDSVLDMNTVREKSPNPIGFGAPAMAFKYQQPQRQPMGFTNPDVPTHKAPASKPTSAKLGTAEKQLNMPEFGRVELSTYNHELAGHGIHSPDDKALNKAADKADIQRIIEKGLSTGKSSPVHSANDPVHSTPANVRVHKADNVRVHQNDEAALLAALKDAQGKIDADTLREAFGLYKQWIDSVMTNKQALSARGGKQFINAELCQSRKKTITPSGMDALLNVWRKRAGREGILRVNPKYTGKPPHPEYLLA